MSTAPRAASDTAESGGYLHRLYAESFHEFGRPRELPRSGGWLVERDIGGTGGVDAMGCYPMFACNDWPSLGAELESLAAELVSVVMVTDPFGGYSEAELKRSFDRVDPYKRHYVTDLSRPSAEFVRGRHRRNAAHARDRMRLETLTDPAAHLDEWVHLYAHLVDRHRITGIPAFSPAAFAYQLRVPGLVMFRASAEEGTVGLHLWYVQGDVAYGHLGASNARGYELMASYALYGYAIEQLRDRVGWLDSGGVAGLDDDADDGLREFKRGWSTDTRPVFLCGRVLQPGRYAELTRERNPGATTYFPAYRAGEFSGARRASPTSDAG